jgi:hypothetical protein
MADRISQHFIDTKGMTKDEALEAARKVVESEVKIDLENPQHLEGYEYGRTQQLRREKHQVILPRATINQYLSGGASNDAGFSFTDEGCEYDISDYDEGAWWSRSKDRWWQVADTKEAIDLAWSHPDVVGVDVEENEEGNFEIYCIVND